MCITNRRINVRRGGWTRQPSEGYAYLYTHPVAHYGKGLERDDNIIKGHIRANLAPHTTKATGIQ